VQRRSLNKAEECTRSCCVYLLSTSGPASCAILIKPVYLQRSDSVTNQRHAPGTGVVRFSAQKDSIKRLNATGIQDVTKIALQ
jgi:hypothetical protein